MSYLDSCQITAWINRGSTPSRSPVRKMIQSKSGLPDVGISSGIISNAATTGLALTAGANARLKKTPVRLVKRKREIRAQGANLKERKWGIFRGNLIQRSPCLM